MLACWLALLLCIYHLCAGLVCLLAWFGWARGLAISTAVDLRRESVEKRSRYTVLDWDTVLIGKVVLALAESNQAGNITSTEVAYTSTFTVCLFVP